MTPRQNTMAEQGISRGGGRRRGRMPLTNVCNKYASCSRTHKLLPHTLPLVHCVSSSFGFARRELLHHTSQPLPLLLLPLLIDASRATSPSLYATPNYTSGIMADDEHNKKPKKPSGALNVERRTWDLEHFEKVAKERLEQVCKRV